MEESVVDDKAGAGSLAYHCPECGKEYSAEEAAQSGSFCSEPQCADQMILLDASNEESGAAKAEIGLGMLICDVSGSMEDFASSKVRVSKMTLMAKSVARGVWDLVEEMMEASQKKAYVALIYFSKEAEVAKDGEGHPFIKSVYEIGRMFGSAKEFADYLSASMRKAQRSMPKNAITDAIFGQDNTKHYTNINAALSLAHQIKEACLQSSLNQFGGPDNIAVIKDVCITPDGLPVTVPNIRCLIYSDGAHNYPKGSPIENPFDNDETSVLITSFIGPESDSGKAQMENVAGMCPKHGYRSFFLADNTDSYQKLRGLFRMSSGVSGFCPNCMPHDV